MNEANVTPEKCFQKEYKVRSAKYQIIRRYSVIPNYSIRLAYLKMYSMNNITCTTTQGKAYK